MYQDKKNKRILLKDGTSVLSAFGYAKNIVVGNEMEELVKVAECFDSLMYDKLNRTDMSHPMNDVNPEPEDHSHTDDELTSLYEMAISSSRFDDSNEQRLLVELDYFDRTKNIRFILKCVDLIEKFRQDKIVWGVGRGSACASYLCYVLYIHDIDPIRFSIPFKELSKEDA